MNDELADKLQRAAAEQPEAVAALLSEAAHYIESLHRDRRRMHWIDLQLRRTGRVVIDRQRIEGGVREPMVWVRTANSNDGVQSGPTHREALDAAMRSNP